MIFSALLGLIGAVAGSLITYKATQKTNTQNAAINQQNLDYNTAMTQQQWERDDNAHQREVADLEAAGLSPLANTTGSQVTSALAAPTPLGMQAPKLDTNSLVQAALGAAQLDETKRHNKANEEYQEGLLQNQAEEINQKAKQLDIENKRVEETIRYQTELNKIESEKLDEIIRSNKKGEQIKLSEQQIKELEIESKRYAEEIAKKSGGHNYQEYNDFDLYYNAKKLWNVSFSNFIDKLGATSTSKGENKSQSLGGNIGLNVAANGGNLGANESTSQGTFNSENISEKQKAMLENFYQENPVPVFISKDDYKKLRG